MKIIFKFFLILFTFTVASFEAFASEVRTNLIGKYALLDNQPSYCLHTTGPDRILEISQVDFGSEPTIEVEGTLINGRRKIGITKVKHPDYGTAIVYLKVKTDSIKLKFQELTSFAETIISVKGVPEGILIDFKFDSPIFTSEREICRYNKVLSTN